MTKILDVEDSAEAEISASGYDFRGGKASFRRTGQIDSLNDLNASNSSSRSLSH
jgi:hypothetical protein